MHIPTSEIGRWDEALFQRFKRARTQHERRELLDALLRVNRPLVKLLVGQLAGTAQEKTTSRRRRPTRMRVVGADQLPWEDLMQAGMQGMAHALVKFNPEKGKISGYARWWVLTNLQRLVKKTWRPDEAPLDWSDTETVTLSGIDATACDGRDEKLLSDNVSLAQLDAWEDAGQWPPELAWARAAYLKLRMPKAYSVAARPIDSFLERMCVFGRRADRAPVYPLWNAWRLECRREGRAEGSRKGLLVALARHGATAKKVRYQGQSDRGVSHARLVHIVEA